MPITPDALHNELRTLKRCYWISGDELLLQTEAQTAIRNAAQTAGYTARAVFTVDRHLNWQEVQARIRTRSLFDDKTLLELRFPQAKFSKSDQEALLELIKQPATQALLLITSPKLSSAIQQATWFKTLLPQMTWVAVWPLTSQQFLPWLAKRAQARGMTIATTGLALLADQCEGNLWAAEQLLEQLQLIYGSSQLTTAAIAEVVSLRAQYDIFECVDAALIGQSQRALRMLWQLQLSGEEPILMLWALARECRSLAMMQADYGRLSLSQILSAYRVFEKRKPVITAALKRCTVNHWQQLLQLAATIDTTIKGVHPGNVWNLLARLLLSMSTGVVWQN